MPSFRQARQSRRGIIAAAIALTAAIAAPGQASAAIANPHGCSPQPTLSQSFAPWGDNGLYTPVPNAGLENGATGWTLTGDAAVVEGNEPWQIGGESDSHSLDLPPGSSATTAELCIDETYPHFRLFVRNAREELDELRIEVLYLDDNGQVVSTAPYDYATDSTSWQPSGQVGISVFDSASTVIAAPVAFRFTPLGAGAHFQIDDVYVDPWARG